MTGTLTHAEGRFAGRGGLGLYRQSWRPPGAPRAVVVNLHGLGDHSGLYPTLVEYLVGRRSGGLQSFDLRGNGLSAGARGHVSTWDGLPGRSRRLPDARRAGRPGTPHRPDRQQSRRAHRPGVRPHASRRPLRGVAVSAPLGALGVPAPLMALGRMLSRVWPRFSLETGMDLSGLARDPGVIEQILSDPLFHRRATARLSTEVTAAIGRVQEGATSFALPLLVLHGSDDRMVPPAGSRAFAARAPSAGTRLVEYPGAYHALFADMGREQVLADVAGWIEARLS